MRQRLSSGIAASARQHAAGVRRGLLIKLQPGQISEIYAKALGSGRKDGTGGLSPASVKQALAVAVTEWLLLPWNPTDPIKAPNVKRTNMRALDIMGTAALLEAARPYRLFILSW